MAKVAAHRTRHKAAKLFVQGPVQPQIAAHQLNRRGIGFAAGGQPRGVTGQQMNKEEDQHRDDGQRGQQAQQAL